MEEITTKQVTAKLLRELAKFVESGASAFIPDNYLDPINDLILSLMDVNVSNKFLQKQFGLTEGNVRNVARKLPPEDKFKNTYAISYNKMKSVMPKRHLACKNIS